MIKKLVLIIIGIFLIALVATLIYFRLWQNLPEFSISILDQLQTPKTGEKVLIFSPHTDDEVLGTGGLIYDSIQNGASVTVVFLTNGDGHRFSSVEEFHKIYPNAQNYIQSGYLRQNESKNALKTLGIKNENIIFLGYPDGGLKAMLQKNWSSAYESPYTKQSSSPYNNSYHENVSYTGQNLQNDVLKILEQTKPDYIFVSHPKDMHPDHAAAPQFLNKALAIYTEKNPKTNYQLYYYLVHFRHYPYPKGNHPDHYLMPPLRLLTGSWLQYDLSAQTENIKAKALTQYQSQLKVPLLHSLMEGFVKKNELFVKEN